MDVFLIPVAADRYEPYCEVPDDDLEATADEPRRGWMARVHATFRRVVATAERERRGGDTPRDVPSGWTGRVRSRVVRWIAERVAEQRLLWHLRRQDAAVLVHPADVPGEEALALLRAILRRDGDRHRRWMIVHGALLAASSVLTLIPGPNLLWWYFAFRAVGHYLSWRGARGGALRVQWTLRPSMALVDLRRALTLAPDERARHVVDVASRLQLEHLATFVERTALFTA